MISEDRLSFIMANSKDISHFKEHEQAFSKLFRSFSDECKLDSSCMLVDYSIKNARTDLEIDDAYAS